MTEDNERIVELCNLVFENNKKDFLENIKKYEKTANVSSEEIAFAVAKIASDELDRLLGNI